jgi:soluble lytic murein transglycosylase-like protein
MRISYKQAAIRTIFIGLVLLVSAPLHADYYKYIGPRGEILFTDKPMEAPYKMVWRKDRQFITMAKTLSDGGKASNSKAKASGGSNGFKIKKSKVSYFTPRVDYNSMYLNRVRYSDMIDEAARKARLYPALLHAVVKAESAYDPNAVSPAGAIGLMQLMPITAKRYGVKDRRDPKANLEGGARYLRKLLTRYNNNIKLALAAYNAGHKAVKKYGNKIPPYPETQNYVKKVIAYYIQNRRRLAQVN